MGSVLSPVFITSHLVLTKSSQDRQHKLETEAQKCYFSWGHEIIEHHQLYSLGMLNLNLCRRRQWHPTPVLLPGKPHGRRSLVGCSPWGHQGSDTTERLHFHFSLSCTGEGNGNPLQCPCLENPKDGEAWWAAIYGVAQSQTWLKRRSSNLNLKNHFGI